MKKVTQTPVCRRILYSLLFAFIATAIPGGSGFAQIPIPGTIKKSVSFLFAHDWQRIRAGTAFYFSMEGEKPGYLVTAKHVLVSPLTKQYFPNVCIRVNDSKGGSDLIPIQLSGPRSSHVFVHKQPEVDIAVIPPNDIPLSPGKNAGDYEPPTTLGSSLLVTKDHFARGYVQEGDEVFFVGWFKHYYGAAKNYPIVRFGRLAMITDEKIPWSDEMVSLYLIEAHSTHGNSGAPVFFRPNLQREPGVFIPGRQGLYLAGILKGFFHEPDQEASSQNAGIAAVVPGSQLREILLSDEVKQQRAAPRKIALAESKEIEACHRAEKVFSKTLQPESPKQ